MSRTPPARPYPRTTSSPDCADPRAYPGHATCAPTLRPRRSRVRRLPGPRGRGRGSAATGRPRARPRRRWRWRSCRWRAAGRAAAGETAASRTAARERRGGSAKISHDFKVSPHTMKVGARVHPRKEVRLERRRPLCEVLCPAARGHRMPARGEVRSRCGVPRRRGRHVGAGEAPWHAAVPQGAPRDGPGTRTSSTCR